MVAGGSTRGRGQYNKETSQYGRPKRPHDSPGAPSGSADGPPIGIFGVPERRDACRRFGPIGIDSRPSESFRRCRRGGEKRCAVHFPRRDGSQESGYCQRRDGARFRGATPTAGSQARETLAGSPRVGRRHTPFCGGQGSSDRKRGTHRRG